MTTSGTGRTIDGRRPGTISGGYTILEIVLVIAIGAALVGLAVPVVDGMVRGEKLREPARKLEVLAVTARIRAIEEQRPYQIVFDPAGFRLEADPAFPRRIGLTQKGEPPPPPAELQKTADYRLPAGVSMEVRSWPLLQWERPVHRTWIFPPAGLCEPLTVRFTLGDAWFMSEYDPMTGWTADETYFMP